MILFPFHLCPTFKKISFPLAVNSKLLGGFSFKGKGREDLGDAGFVCVYVIQ